MDNFLWGVITTIVVGVPAAYYVNITTPRVQAWFQDRGNNRRSRSLSQLEKEDAAVRKLHDDTGELLRYGLYHLSETFGAVLVVICANLVLLGHSAQVDPNAVAVGLNVVTLDRIIAGIQPVDPK